MFFPVNVFASTEETEHNKAKNTKIHKTPKLTSKVYTII